MLSRRAIALLILVYAILLVDLQLSIKYSLRLTHIIPLLFPLALLQRDAKKFLLDWTPFYLIILVYDSFRGLADDFAARVDFQTLISWEKALFSGSLPTVVLQNYLGQELQGVLGRILAIFYFGHFLLPVMTLYILWRYVPYGFKVTMRGIALLSFLGFVTYFFFPAAPPWMASEKGHIPVIRHLVLDHLYAFRGDSVLSNLYVKMNPNPVAAFPSLHAGYPFLLWVCIKRFMPGYQLWYLVNFLIVSFTIVAFGEHYVVDVLAGMIWACASLFIIGIAEGVKRSPA